MTSSIKVGSVGIGGPIEFGVVGESGGSITPIAPDGSGVLQVTWGAGSLIVAEDGSVIRGIAITENGDPWEPSDGAYMWVLRAASTYAVVHVEDLGVSAEQRIASASAWSPFVIGPEAIQIFYYPATSRWVVPNWSPRQIGEVMVYGPAAGEPFGWIEADGSTPLIADYPLLADALGTTYGGNGTTTFGLPGPGPAPLRWLIFTGGV